MSINQFGVDTAFPPPPNRYIPDPQRPATRRWPALVAAAAIGGVIASTAAVTITLQTRDIGAKQPGLPAAVTVTVPAPAPTPPDPLPAAQADRQTCQQGWLQTGRLIDSATDALNVLPQGMKVYDPAARSNPEWTAAIETASSIYRQASDTLNQAIAPGTTRILLEAATTTVKAMRSLSDAIATPNEINGNAFDIANEAAAQIGVLCTRLAP